MADFSKLNLRRSESNEPEASETLSEDSSEELSLDEFDSVDDHVDPDEFVESSVEEQASSGLRTPFRLRLPGGVSPTDANTAPSPAVEERVTREGSELEQEELEPAGKPSSYVPEVVDDSLVDWVPAGESPSSEGLSTSVDMGDEAFGELDELFPEDSGAGFDAVNPLLEDDEELWEGESEPDSKAALIRGVTGEIMDRDDLDESDFATFEGFEAPAGEPLGANPLLEEDDDYVPASVNPFLDEEDEEEFSVPEPPAGEVDKLHSKVQKNAEPRRFFPEGLDPEFDKRVIEAPSRKEVVAAEREEKIRKAEAAKAKAKEFKSEFQKKATETVNVNELGETKNEQGKERKRLAKTGPKGKLAKEELEFYKNLGTRKTKYSAGLKTTDLLSGPLNEYATPEQRRERKNRLERVMDSRVAYRQGANFILNEKMTQTLSYLALFRYATHSHVARMFGESPRTTLDRLYRMQANGLVDSRKIYAQHAIWFLTEPGLIVSGYDVRKVTDSRLTYSMFPHQFTVNHVAANLWGGKLNVLNLPDFPSKNRVNSKGAPVLGEQLTSELEVLSSFAKMKLFEDSSSFRPKLMGLMDGEFKKWADSDRSVTPSPELIYGNEWMFTLFPPLSVGIAYHVPDLVVKRPRGRDGSPGSIAVEIEINNKPIGSYKKTLEAYAADKRIFDKVVWVCKTIGPAKKLEKIGRELGIYQSGKLKIVPIWTNDGVFKGRDLWTI